MSGSLQQYATQEPPEFHWFERANYIAVNVGLIAYGKAYTDSGRNDSNHLRIQLLGMHIIAMCACAYYLVQEKNIKKNVKWLLFIFVLFACGTVNISINMTFNEWAWIDFREYPGGPLQFLLEQQSNVVNTWGNAISTVVELLTDALLVSLPFRIGI